MRITPSSIAAALDECPRWALIALSTRSEKLHADAKQEIGQHLYSALYQPIDVHTDQLALPL